jgi:ABC-type lipoprotein release transport system permease subunit
MWLGLKRKRRICHENPETVSGACEELCNGQRSREFGIRIAVGATRGNVMAVVFHKGLVLTLIGASVGVGAALPAARALTQLLFGISPLDATSFARLSFCWD